MSKIEWTGSTWNPVVGCDKVSAGCKNCYAINMANRLQGIKHSAAKYAGTVEKTNGGKLNWTGKINLSEADLLKPLKTKKPTTWFVNSMSDLFHDGVPFDFIDKVFAVMAATPHHTYQILTKRPERMVEWYSGKRARICTELDLLSEELEEKGDLKSAEACIDASVQIIHDRWPLANVWIGVSVEDQKAADERIPYLLKVPAAVRFLSCEPLLGAIDITQKRINYSVPTAYYEGIGIEWTDPGDKYIGLDWVIAGGESGHGARPVHPDWLRSLRDQCKEAGVPFFFKQWGEWLAWERPGTEEILGHLKDNQQVSASSIKGCHVLYERMGKDKAGRLLDGIEHNEMPIIK